MQISITISITIFCTVEHPFYGDRPSGTPPAGMLSARGVAKYSDFGL